MVWGSRSVRSVGIAALVIGACFLLQALLAQSYGDKASSSTANPGSTYNFRFGPGNISAPGNARMENGGFVEPGAFPTAEYCGYCHQEAYAQWRQALHSNSFRTPFYRASVNILMRTKGIEYTRHCDSCHNPIGVLSGALTQDSKIDRKFDEDGLTCTICHSIQKLQSTLGNGGFVMGIPAVMVDENGNRIAGEVPYNEIVDHPERHAKAVMKDIYKTPEFCASCHKANLPNPLNEYKWIRAFTSFDEWQNSKFSERNPLTFYSAKLTTCQNCHMMREPAVLHDSGAKNGTLASHRWPAGNTAVPFYYGFDQQLQKTIDFLKSGKYLNVDLVAIKKSDSDNLIAPLGSVPFQLSRNQKIEAMVVIQNKNIGHSLIPEVRDLYEAWVEFTVKDATGREIVHSGFLKPDGTLEPRAHSFTNRPVNSDGNFVDNHKVWTIHSMAYDNSIQAGRSALVRYQFTVPQDAQGPLTVTARVNYRHFRQSYLNNVFGPDHPAYPVIELASKTRTLMIGDNPVVAADPQDNPDWMRWNNLGIGYLDQLQYADAVHAFREVVKLRPDYSDGYINIGLTYIEWEKYSEARASLEKGLALSRDNARALYYLAIVERRAGNSEAELTDLTKVVAAYPQSRDARRELGVYYYQQHQPEEAIKQFEALQAIDPDDVAAHYNLAILYKRMGLKEKASEQAALFATKQIDPGAPTYSLDFLRNHPEISNESVPWHMHTDAAPPAAVAGEH
ncbi:tetratricopeptide repeat protein [Nevskia soli]|uniref:tetratricopeptide repeat protein n=1 Tax=Nevskia soli TaxID=418856 RepID=UPI0015D7C3B5|nr:tetratricopeptide repeat protein [Nevskia soli]